jgi:uncharacterized protein
LFKHLIEEVDFLGEITQKQLKIFINKKNMLKKQLTLVIGASENPERYSFKATKSLLSKGFKVKLLGKAIGKVEGIEIMTGQPALKNIHTVTLYIGPQHQPNYYDYIIGLAPKRVIFNPGTENREFEVILKANAIASEQACTLVLLSLNAY